MNTKIYKLIFISAVVLVVIGCFRVASIVDTEDTKPFKVDEFVELVIEDINHGKFRKDTIRSNHIFITSEYNYLSISIVVDEFSFSRNRNSRNSNKYLVQSVKLNGIDIIINAIHTYDIAEALENESVDSTDNKEAFIEYIKKRQLIY